MGTWYEKPPVLLRSQPPVGFQRRSCGRPARRRRLARRQVERSDERGLLPARQNSAVRRRTGEKCVAGSASSCLPTSYPAEPGRRRCPGQRHARWPASLGSLAAKDEWPTRYLSGTGFPRDDNVSSHRWGHQCRRWESRIQGNAELTLRWKETGHAWTGNLYRPLMRRRRTRTK